MGHEQRGVVMLAAGSGSRMAPLTAEVAKPMLDVGGLSLLERIVQAAIDEGAGEINVVVGYRGDSIQSMIQSRFSGRVRCVQNHRFDVDRNIYSVQIGVDALEHPERGYTIVETDLLVESEAWRELYAAAREPFSFLATSGRYGPDLTGGIVHVDANGWVDAIEYQPRYELRYDGWPKMLGVLSVGPGEVSLDRALRRAAVDVTIDRYYFAPWAEARAQLPCRIVDLGTRFARSFNTPGEFEQAAADYLALCTRERPALP